MVWNIAGPWLQIAEVETAMEPALPIRFVRKRRSTKSWTTLKSATSSQAARATAADEAAAWEWYRGFIKPEERTDQPEL
jgi:hypothetical protein